MGALASIIALTFGSNECRDATFATAPPKNRNGSNEHYIDASTVAGDTQRHSIRAHGSQPTCFRITGVPSHWGTDELEEKLKSIDPDINLTNVDLSKFPACSYWTKTSTALLRLNRNTIYFDGWKQSEEKQILFREQGRTVRLNMDKDFYGLTPLNNPKIPITAEFVPLHTF
jgi:hypothetical protein